MSLGSIPRQSCLSENQFLGDLVGLFQRRHISVGEPKALEEFERNLETNVAFRSQFLTMCTAISHMSEEDLSGDQLLVLIGRALGAGEVSDSVRAAFLSAYDAWSNRNLDVDHDWSPVRQVEENHTESSANVAETQEVQVPGQRTIQEALEIARQRSSSSVGSEEPRPRPPAGVEIEGMTLNELTSLLEDIERRMNRIRPQVQSLASAAHTTVDRSTPEPARSPVLEFPKPAGSASQHLDALQDFFLPDSAGPIPADAEQAFLQRHSYMRRERVLPPELFHPPGRLIPMVKPASEDGPDPPQANEPMLVTRQPHEAAEQPQAGLDASRMRSDLVLGVLATLIMVAIFLGGVMFYRSTQPVYRYHDLQPQVQSPSSSAVGAQSVTEPSPDPSAKPKPKHRSRRQSSANAP